MGLMHRDIKPGKILVCERAGLCVVAKLLEFGRVKHVGISDPQLTLEGTVAGTPAYMSPEQAAGSGHADARTDIYSLGAVAYFILTGRPPFTNRSATQVMAAHMYEAPAPIIAYRPEVGAVLDDIVRRCLAKNPADRFADTRALQQALEQYGGAAWLQQDAQEWWRQYESTQPHGHA